MALGCSVVEGVAAGTILVQAVAVNIDRETAEYHFGTVRNLCPWDIQRMGEAFLDSDTYTDWHSLRLEESHPVSDLLSLG